MRVLRVCVIIPLGLAAAHLDGAAMVQTGYHADPLQKPTKAQVQKVRTEVRSSVDHVLDRATKKVNLPIPSVFRWDLVGKITTWIMDQYQTPKTAANNDLTDGMIDMVSKVLSGDISKMSDEEVATALLDWTSLQKMTYHWADQVGAAPSFVKLVDSTFQAVKSHKASDPESTAKMIIDLARETSGEPLANLFTYIQKVAKKDEEPDQAKALEMVMPVFTQMGAPPAIEELIKGSVEQIRSKEVVNSDKETARVFGLVAKACTQLNLPGAVGDMFNLAAEMHNQPPNAEQEARFFDIAATLIEQIEGPHTFGEMFHFNADTKRSGVQEADWTKVNELIQKALTEVGLPSSVGETVAFLQSHDIAQPLDKEAEKKLAEITARVMDQAGLPPAAIKAEQDMADAMGKGEVSQEKIFKTQMQMLRKMKLNSLADVLNAFISPILKGKKPDALALAAAAPAMMKLTDDLSTMNGIAHKAGEKLFGSMGPVFDRMLAKTVEKMPNSFLKDNFKVNMKRLLPHM